MDANVAEDFRTKLKDTLKSLVIEDGTETDDIANRLFEIMQQIAAAEVEAYAATHAKEGK